MQGSPNSLGEGYTDAESLSTNVLVDMLTGLLLK